MLLPLSECEYWHLALKRYRSIMPELMNTVICNTRICILCFPSNIMYESGYGLKSYNVEGFSRYIYALGIIVMCIMLQYVLITGVSVITH